MSKRNAKKQQTPDIEIVAVRNSAILGVLEQTLEILARFVSIETYRERMRSLVSIFAGTSKLGNQLIELRARARAEVFLTLTREFHDLCQSRNSIASSTKEALVERSRKTIDQNVPGQNSLEEALELLQTGINLVRANNPDVELRLRVLVNQGSNLVTASEQGVLKNPLLISAHKERTEKKAPKVKRPVTGRFADADLLEKVEGQRIAAKGARGGSSHNLAAAKVKVVRGAEVRGTGRPKTGKKK